MRFAGLFPALAAVLVMAAACAEWPPSESEARQHFADERASFDRLAEKMRATDYWRVSLQNTGTVKVRVTPPDAEAWEDEFVIDDDPEWHELLTAVGAFMVVQSENGAVWTDPAGLWDRRENRTGFNGFTNDPNMLDGYLPCEPRHEDIPCGHCAVELEDGWYIHYVWAPEVFSQDEWQAYLNDEISVDAYNDSYVEALNQCTALGRVSMGYDN